MKHVFIIGSRGLPGKYGGFETFTDQLVSHKISSQIKYHVANLSDTENGTHFDYRGADVFNVNPIKAGGARVIFYDIKALNLALKICADEKIERPVFYILGNTIGAIIAYYARKIHKIGGVLFVNPDGLEWRRSKWSKPIQKYLKFSEKMMTRKADLIISDNQGIEDYLKSEYGDVTSKVLAYGTETIVSQPSEADDKWFDDHQIKKGHYFLMVGRFVPENNFELLIKSFMASTTLSDLVIVTNYEGNPFYESLRESTSFEQDERIKFVGTVYDKNLLLKIRENAQAYLHGHEVGGTNPSLLEAMWSSRQNLVLDVTFNRNVVLDSAVLFDRDNLTEKINLSETVAEDLQIRSQEIILSSYTWPIIVQQYEDLFLNYEN